MAPDEAWIGGAPASLGEAINAAAQLIEAARLPLVTGLRTDVAGVKSALALARVAGGVVDHAGSGTVYPTLEVLRTAGMFVAAPAEMRRRADRFLVIGGDAAELSPDLLAFVLGGTKDLGRVAADGLGRRIVWLGGTDTATLGAGGTPVEAISCSDESLPDALATIRAALAGRCFGAGPIPAEKAREIAALLGGAGFACVLWSATALDRLGVEMASGLVADLNEKTRASSLPLFGPGQAFGAAQIATAVSGYPLRVSFGRVSEGEGAEHDPHAFETRRLIASGECDLVVHVSALAGDAARDAAGDTASAPMFELPFISIASEPVPGAAVSFVVGLAGRDHSGALYSDKAGSFVAVDAPEGAAIASAADILGRIMAAIDATASERAA